MLGIGRTYQGGNWQSNLTATPNTTSPGTTVTASSTIHTKGSYTQLIASTTYDWHGFWLYACNTNVAGSATDLLLDIAIGGAGSEQIILPDWMAGWSAASNAGSRALFVPIFIPRGTRIAGRCQALIASDTVSVLLFGVPGNSGLPTPLFSNCDTYGIDAATSSGTSHTPGNSGAESTAANVGGTTSRIYGAVMLGVASQSATTTAIAYHWELMVGGVTLAEWYTNNTTSELVHGPWPPCPSRVSIPGSTQLQVRGEASGTAQAQDLAFYCFY
jgi:hypothetical protein